VSLKSNRCFGNTELGRLVEVSTIALRTVLSAFPLLIYYHSVSTTRPNRCNQKPRTSLTNRVLTIRFGLGAGEA
jgi:hypothetical protein